MTIHPFLLVFKGTCCPLRSAYNAHLKGTHKKKEPQGIRNSGRDVAPLYYLVCSRIISYNVPEIINTGQFLSREIHSNV